MKFHSSAWFGPKDKAGFIHRSWMKNQGLPDRRGSAQTRGAQRCAGKDKERSQPAGHAHRKFSWGGD